MPVNGKHLKQLKRGECVKAAQSRRQWPPAVPERRLQDHKRSEAGVKESEEIVASISEGITTTRRGCSAT